jgi:hypothetical protein
MEINGACSSGISKTISSVFCMSNMNMIRLMMSDLSKAASLTESTDYKRLVRGGYDLPRVHCVGHSGSGFNQQQMTIYFYYRFRPEIIFIRSNLAVGSINSFFI